MLYFRIGEPPLKQLRGRKLCEQEYCLIGICAETLGTSNTVIMKSFTSLYTNLVTPSTVTAGPANWFYQFGKEEKGSLRSFPSQVDGSVTCVSGWYRLLVVLSQECLLPEADRWKHFFSLI